MQAIRLETSDGVGFNVDLPIANMFGTVSQLLENYDPAEVGVIPLPNVRSEILALVLQFAQHHLTYPQPVENEDDIRKWNLLFLDNPSLFPRSILFELMHAANYLDFENLLGAACVTVAYTMKENYLQEIYDILDAVSQNY